MAIRTIVDLIAVSYPKMSSSWNSSTGPLLPTIPVVMSSIADFTERSAGYLGIVMLPTPLATFIVTPMWSTRNIMKIWRGGVRISFPDVL